MGIKSEVVATPSPCNTCDKGQDNKWKNCEKYLHAYIVHTGPGSPKVVEECMGAKKR